MALTVTVNKYASSNLQAVHRTQQGTAAKPITSTNVGLGRRGLVLSTVVAATQVSEPDSRTELLKSMHNSPQFFFLS